MSAIPPPKTELSKLPCTKVCKQCLQTKPRTEFFQQPRCSDGLFARCKACAKKASRAWALANPEATRAAQKRSQKKHRKKRCAEATAYYHLHRAEKAAYKKRRNITKHGISEAAFHTMVEAQGGKCAICAQPPKRGRLHIDHNHQTGAVRGLLCSPCNTGLGLFAENPQNLNSAISYLQKFA